MQTASEARVATELAKLEDVINKRKAEGHGSTLAWNISQATVDKLRGLGYSVTEDLSVRTSGRCCHMITWKS